MKTIEEILELIKLNAYSGTPENMQAITDLVNEAQKQAFCQPPDRYRAKRTVSLRWLWKAVGWITHKL